MAQLDLCIILGKPNELIASFSNTNSFAFPDLQEGDTPSVGVTVLKQIAPLTSIAPFQYIEPDTYTLRAGLFLKASPFTAFATMLAVDFTTDLGNHRKYGVLNLGTAAIDTATTAGDVSGCRFEIEMTEIATGAIATIYRKNDVNLLKDYLDNALTGLPASEAAASQAYVRNGFVPKYPINLSEMSQRYEVDETGQVWRIYRGTDGLEKSQQFTPPS